MQLRRAVVPDLGPGALLQLEYRFFMYFFYSALLALGLLVSLPYWLFQMLRRNKYRSGLAERLGRLPPRFRSTGQGDKPAIWVHAVSVGEVLAVSQLVTQIRSHLERYRVMVSTTTDTGQKLAREKFGAENVFYFPLDFAFAIRPYLSALRPVLVVLAETEFWPNFVRLCRARTRIAVVNARISDHSLSGYRRVRFVLRRVLTQIDLYLAQTEEDRKRLIGLGAPPERVQVTGNLKYDVAPPARAAIVSSLRSALHKTGAGPVIVGGSTMDGEESLLLRAFEIVRGSHPRAVLIIAPRHPQRFEPVAEFVKSLGIPVWRRSFWSGEDLSGAVLVLDTIGELASVYEVGDVAFVGGSLVEYGGHNILEPAQHGVPVIVGPHYANFRDMVNLFRWHDAVRVVGPAELPLCIVELLANEADRVALGRRGLETLRAQMGATQRTLAALSQMLPRDVPDDCAVSGVPLKQSLEGPR